MPSNHKEGINTTLKEVPVGAHIHGLEVRPTFDGNPLSSMNMKGRFGVGYQSLGNKYFTFFNDYMKTPFQISK